MNGAIGLKRATHCGRFEIELNNGKMENNETIIEAFTLKLYKYLQSTHFCYLKMLWHIEKYMSSIKYVNFKRLDWLQFRRLNLVFEPKTKPFW